MAAHRAAILFLQEGLFDKQSNFLPRIPFRITIGVHAACAGINVECWGHDVKKRKRQTGSISKERPPLTVRKKLLFGILTTAIFFLLIEGSLLLLGVEPNALRQDPLVGFAGRNPLFVSASSGDQLTTATNKLSWFNEQSFDRNKSADAYRIFCLGGSTTYGRPYNDTTSFCGWLRELLGEADTSRNYEVINAGGISYASYRVTAVLEEILQYSPNLVIVYTGHNEFLEDRTYRSIRSMPAFLKHTHAALSQTRTYSFVNDRFSSDGTTPVDASQLLPAEVKTRLDDGVGPDAFDRDDALRQNIHEQFEFNLQRIIDMTRQAGAEILLVVPASNLEDCSPFKSMVDSNLPEEDQSRIRRSLAQAESHLAEREFAAAQASVEQALAIDNRCADAHFLKGKALAASEQWSDARTAFITARNEDVCTLRATSEIESIVRRVADAEQVPVVDFQAVVDLESEHRIPGNALFLDHVHPTIEGHRLLALQIVNKLSERRLLPIDAPIPSDTIDKVSELVMSRVDQQANGDALRNLAKVFRWAGKTAEADRMAIRADALVAGDPNVLYLAANALIAEGNYRDAVAKLNQAIELDPRHAPSWVSLGVAKQRTDDSTAAFESFHRALELDPDSLMALNNLASAYVQQEKWDLAAEHLRRAIRLNPRYAKAYHNLGIVYSKQQKWDAAVQSLEQSVEISPDVAQPHLDLANIYRSQGDMSKSVLHFQRALQADSSQVQVMNTLAWLLATTSEEEVRDAREALRLSLQCAEKTNYRNPAVFNTLAAAYAANGDFENAIQWQTRALAAAPPSMKPTCQRRLETYRKGQSLIINSEPAIR